MRYKSKWISIILCVLLFFTFIGCNNEDERKSGGFFGTVNGVTFELADLGENVNLHSDLQNQYYADLLDNNFYYDGIALYGQGVAEESAPVPVKLSWAVSGNEETNYFISLSENKDMSNLFYSEKTNECNLEIFNLKIATTYYWTVSVVNNNNTVTSGVAYFTTEKQGPRNLYVEGVTNVRDLGGWQTESGRVKQGMIYRCARLNASNDYTPTNEITETGINIMKNVLRVKSEIDLRKLDESGRIEKSPLGNDVNYVRYSMDFDGEIVEDNIEPIKQLFSFLANENNYPVIFHCHIGTDRTGLIAFFINALMGVSEGDLQLDYVYSNFAQIGGSRSADVILEYIAMVNKAEGNSLKEKVYNYLVGIGVSGFDLSSLIQIMKE